MLTSDFTHNQIVQLHYSLMACSRESLATRVTYIQRCLTTVYMRLTSNGKPGSLVLTSNPIVPSSPRHENAIWDSIVRVLSLPRRLRTGKSSASDRARRTFPETPIQVSLIFYYKTHAHLTEVGECTGPKLGSLWNTITGREVLNVGSRGDEEIRKGLCISRPELNRVLMLSSVS